MSEPSKQVAASLLSRLPPLSPRSPGRAPHGPTEEDDHARRRLVARLEALPQSVEPPSIDPRTVAVAALMVANFVAQDHVRRRFVPLVSARVFDAAALDDLPVAARLVMRILPKAGIELHECTTTPPADLLRAATGLRGEMLAVAERHLDDFDEAHGRLTTIRVGDRDADLVFGLRMLADVWHDYGEVLRTEGGAPLRPEWEGEARALASRLELAIAGPFSEEENEFRAYLFRAIAMLVPLYDEVTRAGRFLFHDVQPEARFPTLASVARVRRRVARESSKLVEERETVQDPWERVSIPSVPPEASLVDVDALREGALADALSGTPPPVRVALPPQRAPALTPVSDPFLDVVPLDFSPIPAPAEDRDSIPGTAELDLEVTYASDSNFYADLSGDDLGLFIATYVVKPPGTPVTVRLTLPQLTKPVLVSGPVRWVREFSPAIEAPPGMGIALEELGAEAMRAIERFTKARAPLLHDA